MLVGFHMGPPQSCKKKKRDGKSISHTHDTGTSQHTPPVQLTILYNANWVPATLITETHQFPPFLRRKHPRGGKESVGRIRPNQTLCADPSSPHIKDSRELNSVHSAFHCSRLGIMRFGPGHSGSNYSFSTVVFPQDLETQKGKEWSPMLRGVIYPLRKINVDGSECLVWRIYYPLIYEPAA